MFIVSVLDVYVHGMHIGCWMLSEDKSKMRIVGWGWDPRMELEKRDNFQGRSKLQEKRSKMQRDGQGPL